MCKVPVSYTHLDVYKRQGVAGGATAAARIRRLDEHAEITVFERFGYISLSLIHI